MFAKVRGFFSRNAPRCSCGKSMIRLRRGVPIFACSCGAMRVGKNTITMDPANLLRWSATGNPTVAGDLGMDTATGRPTFFRAGAVRNVAGLDDVTSNFTLVQSQTFAANTPVITFSGLSGNSDGVYVLFLSSLIGVGGTPIFTFNGNQNLVVLGNNQLSNAALSGAQTFSCAFFFEAVLTAWRRIFWGVFIEGGGGTSGTRIGELNDVTPITSLELRFQATGSYGNPTHARLYKFGM